MDTIGVAAVRFGEHTVLRYRGDYPALIQPAAVAGDEFLVLHGSALLCHTEAPGPQGQPVGGHGLQIAAKYQVTKGDFPGVAAAVAVDPQGFPTVGAGEAQVPVPGLEEGNIPQAQRGVVPAEPSQTLEMVLQLPVLMAPGERAAVEGILVPFHQSLIPIVDAGAAGEGELKERGHQQPLPGHLQLVTA